MRTKILLLVMLVGVGWSLYAQTFYLGDAVVTKSQFNTADPVVEIYPVGNIAGGGFDNVPPAPTSGGRYGDNWGLNQGHTKGFPDWNVQNLGQVFGLAVNTNSATGSPPQNPFIYVSVTQIYPPMFAPVPMQGGNWSPYRAQVGDATWDPDNNNQTQPSNEGAVLIWRLNPVTGARFPLVISTYTQTWPPPVGTPNAIFNFGSGIGNICYDRDNDQIFATNFEDGRIYRIDAATGNVLSRYDPFGAFACSQCASGNPKFEAVGERLWGIAYNSDDPQQDVGGSSHRLYFAQWANDYEHPGFATPNAIYSIPIDLNGEFASQSATGGPDFTDPVLTSDINIGVVIPSLNPWPATFYGYSNPVADIEFSQDGATMLVAERTIGMKGPTPPTWAYSGTTTAPFGLDVLSWAHRSRLLTYTWGRPAIPLTPGFFNPECGFESFLGVTGQWAEKILPAPFRFQTELGIPSPCANGANASCTQARSVNQYNVGNGNFQFGHPSGPCWRYFGYNAAGGTDFGYASTELPQSCEEYVWATGDRLETGPDGGSQGEPGGNNENEWIYGLAGIPIDGNSYYRREVVCNGVPGCTDYTPPAVGVGENSIYQSIFGGTTITETPKNYSGDVDVFRTACCDLTLTAGITNINCNGGGCTGAIDLTVTPAGSYTYLWSNAATTQDISGLCPGVYSVTVNDLCSASFTVTEPAAIVITETHTNACNALCNGSIDITVNGGVPPYSFIWSNAAITEDISGLCAGNYCVTVTDMNQCSATACITITNVILSVMLTPTGGCPCGTITASVMPPGTYTYGWSGPPGFIINPGSLSITGCPLMSMMNYSVIVTDPSNGCSASATHHWMAPPSPVITVTNTEDECHPVMGSIDISVSGGVIPYNFNWSHLLPMSDPQNVSGLIAGSYTVTVTDANGCTDIETIVIGTCPEDGDCPDVTLDINHTCIGATCTFFNDYLNTAPFTDLNPTDGAGTWDPMPSWITWSVNGVVQGQTTGTGTFDYPFTDEGTYVVCMQAAYLVEHGDHTICCYYDDCEVIHIRGCELWKAGADFTITYGDPDYHEVTVDYTGTFTGDDTWDMTIIWDFGDGTVVISHGDDDVPPHVYANDYTGQICATIIWSIGPWDGSNPEACCCVIEICKDADVTSCQDYELSIEATTDNSITYTVDPLPSTTISWYLNGFPTGVTGPFYTYPFMGMPCIDECVCAHFLVISDDLPYECSVCNTNEGLIENSRVIGYYPNPTNGTTTVELEAIAGEQALIEIFDFTGRFILSKSFANLSYGKNQLPINLAALSNGMYQMRVIIGGETKVVKVIKD